MSRRAVGFLAASVLVSVGVSSSRLAAEDRTQASPPPVARAEAPPPPVSHQPAMLGPGSEQPATPRGNSSNDRPVRSAGEDTGASPRPVPRTVVPAPATERYTEPPTDARWRTRTLDIVAGIKRLARKMGLVQALRVPDELTVIKGVSERPAGWSAWAFAVPAKGTLHVRLTHPNEGWFRLLMMDRGGRIEKGMLQNLIKTGHPQVSFKNPLDELAVVYVLVDDPGWMSTEQSPYVLTIDRDWEPGKVGPKPPETRGGVWAIVEPIIKMEEPSPGEARSGRDRGSVGAEGGPEGVGAAGLPRR